MLLPETSNPHDGSLVTGTQGRDSKPDVDTTVYRQYVLCKLVVSFHEQDFDMVKSIRLFRRAVVDRPLSSHRCSSDP